MYGQTAETKSTAVCIRNSGLEMLLKILNSTEQSAYQYISPSIHKKMHQQSHAFNSSVSSLYIQNTHKPFSYLSTQS